MELRIQTEDGNANDQPEMKTQLPQDLHLRVSIEHIPENLSTLLTNLGNPTPRSSVSKFVKDYLPALTPIATALFTGLVAFYGIKFNDQLTRDTLDKITTEFVENQGKDPGIAALKLAAYGDKALPAVRMVLASEIDDLRSGGELIAQQMYIEETVKHPVLIKEMLHDYENPVLRLGVLEWLSKMGPQLEQADRERFIAKIADGTHGLGPHGENCLGQAENITFAAANVLFAWSPVVAPTYSPQSKDLALGLLENCENSQNPNKYDRTRKVAANALTIIGRSLKPDDRMSLAARLSKLTSAASKDLAAVIANSVTELQKPPRT